MVTVEARLTLVTLDCTPLDIATSLSLAGSARYSPAGLRWPDHVRSRSDGHPPRLDSGRLGQGRAILEGPFDVHASEPGEFSKNGKCSTSDAAGPIRGEMGSPWRRRACGSLRRSACSIDKPATNCAIHSGGGILTKSPRCISSTIDSCAVGGI